MNILIVLAHPNPGSFNHALAHVVRDHLQGLGHDLTLHDLYAERFDPVLPAAESARTAALPSVVAAYCSELASADGMVIIHPNWWGQPPAILKGWIDRVMRSGIAYEFLEGDSGEGIPRPLLKLRSVLVLNTSNTPQQREREVFGDPLDTLWRNCVFGLCSTGIFRRRNFEVVVASSKEERACWLNDARCLAAESFPSSSIPDR